MAASQIADITRRILDRGDQRHRYLQCLPLADDAELGRAAKPLGGKPVLEGLRVLHSLSVDADHHVARLEPSAGGGTADMQVLDQRAAWAVEPKGFAEVLGHRLQGCAEPRTLYRAAFQRRLNYEPHHVGRNRKSDALRPAAAGEDGGIDADEMPVHVDQRTAGIAGIDCGIGLDEELIVGDADLRAREGRDDAARHRLPYAERIADGEHEVAHFESVRVAELD